MTIPKNDAWIDQIFQAKAAKTGGIVRRRVSSVEKYASAALLKKRVKSEGFHMLITGEQYLILCNRGRFKVVC